MQCATLAREVAVRTMPGVPSSSGRGFAPPRPRAVACPTWRTILTEGIRVFLVFEGIDGSGKSSQAERLAAELRARGREVDLVREPGGTPLGEGVRSLVLDPTVGDLAPETEAFLFMAARAHLVRVRIAPALAAGRVVISDRFLWSTVVYQGSVGGVEEEEILRMGRLALGAVEPTRIFLFDLDPETAFARVRESNRMEAKGLDFQRRVRRGFLDLAARFPSECAVIDARGSPEEVFRRLFAALPEEA